MPRFPLVRIARKLLDRTFSYGFVVAEGKSLIAFHSVSDRYDLDGHRVLRRADEPLIEHDFERADLIRRALRLKGLTPEDVPWLELGSMRAVIESVQAHHPVVVIHREHVHPDECEIGTVRMTSDSTYVLRWLDVNGVWDLDHRPFRYDDVTEVSFGAEYETTLAMVAEDRTAG